MKITDIHLYIEGFPTGQRTRYGKLEKTTNLVVVALTNENVLGFGEGNPYYAGIYENFFLCEKIRSQLTGRAIPEAILFLQKMQRDYERKRTRLQDFDFAPFLALESAFLDISGKTHKNSLSNELGGSKRKEVPVCGTIFLDSPDNMAERALYWMSKGVRHLKVKICGMTRIDERNLKRIHDVIQKETIVRVDANQAYKTPEKALNALKKFEKFGVSIVEQPLGYRDLDGLRKLRKLTNVKIMIDESLTEAKDIELISSNESADIINFHPPKLGCLTKTKEAIEKTIGLGLDFMIGSGVMTGIGVAECLHLASSLEELPYPLEEVGIHEMFGMDIVSNPITIEKGFMAIPKDHGLGIKLDKTNFKKFNISISCSTAIHLRTARTVTSLLPTPVGFEITTFFDRIRKRRLKWI
jgi:muconate cycloisomerase